MSNQSLCSPAPPTQREETKREQEVICPCGGLIKEIGEGSRMCNACQRLVF